MGPGLGDWVWAWVPARRGETETAGWGEVRLGLESDEWGRGEAWWGREGVGSWGRHWWGWLVGEREATKAARMEEQQVGSSGCDVWGKGEVVPSYLFNLGRAELLWALTRKLGEAKGDRSQCNLVISRKSPE